LSKQWQKPLATIIVAFAIFILIRAINQMKRKEEPEPEPEPTTKDCPFCCSAIPIKATRCGHCTSELGTA
jgi:large conductance mechanosensitive channel